MSAPVAVFAAAGSQLARWADTALESPFTLVTSVEAIEAQPAQASWICGPEDQDTVRAARPDACVLVMRAPEPVWGHMAHDVRGPVGVIAGVLGELESEDPVLPLARRANRQLAHLADCWEALDRPTHAEAAELGPLLERARKTFGSLEPRRAQKLEIEGASASSLTTDPRRLELGVVRLWSHLSRIRRDALVTRIGEDGSLLFVGAPTSAIADEVSWGRLELARRLLRPITTSWDSVDAGVRWVPAQLG